MGSICGWRRSESDLIHYAMLWKPEQRAAATRVANRAEVLSFLSRRNASLVQTLARPESEPRTGFLGLYGVSGLRHSPASRLPRTRVNCPEGVEDNSERLNFVRAKQDHTASLRNVTSSNHMACFG